MLTSVTHLPYLQNLIQQFPSPFPAQATTEENYDLPRLIHFLWVGSPLPERYARNVSVFMEINPLYDAILWHDSNSESSSLPSRVKAQHIDQLSLPLLPLMGKMSTRIDYIRYVAVNSIGGIYTDIDSVPMNPFDSLVEKAFVSYGPSNIQNSFFGFAAGSSFLSYIISTIKHYANLTDEERCDTFHGKYTGGDLLGACLWKSGDVGIRCIHEELTGHASKWSKVSPRAYMRHMYDYNWGDANDPKGKD